MMAKEHLEYVTAEDTDNLIARLADLNERIESLKENFFKETDEDTKATYLRSAERLTQKKYHLLVALKASLEGLEP